MRLFIFRASLLLEYTCLRSYLMTNSSINNTMNATIVAKTAFHAMVPKQLVVKEEAERKSVVSPPSHAKKKSNFMFGGGDDNADDAPEAYQMSPRGKSKRLVANLSNAQVEKMQRASKSLVFQGDLNTGKSETARVSPVSQGPSASTDEDTVSHLQAARKRSSLKIQKLENFTATLERSDSNSSISSGIGILTRSNSRRLSVRNSASIGSLGSFDEDETVQTSSGSIDVSLSMQNVVSIASGSNHVVIVFGNSSLATWGSNDKGQCDPTKTEPHLPVPTFIHKLINGR
jgi:hypothetical protein